MDDLALITDITDTACINNWGAWGMVNGEGDKPTYQMGDLSIGIYEISNEDIGFYHLWLSEYPEEGSIKFTVNDLVFNHAFAKAFWGEVAEEPCDDCKYKPDENCEVCFPWRYHLQQMVLEDNPLDYIRKYQAKLKV